MAIPHIPNINTLRSSRPNGPGRVRGRGLAGSSREASSDQDKAVKDKVIQQTDRDASVSRLSAVEIGYLDDPFAAILTSSQSPRRFPIINRGDWILFNHSSIKKTNQRQQSPRNIHPHLRHWQSCQPLSLFPPFNAKTNHLPRRRVWHPLLSPHGQDPRVALALPWTRLCRHHNTKDCHYHPIPCPHWSDSRSSLHLCDRSPLSKLPHPLHRLTHPRSIPAPPLSTATRRPSPTHFDHLRMLPHISPSLHRRCRGYLFHKNYFPTLDPSGNDCVRAYQSTRRLRQSDGIKSGSSGHRITDVKEIRVIGDAEGKAEGLRVWQRGRRWGRDRSGGCEFSLGPGKSGGKRSGGKFGDDGRGWGMAVTGRALLRGVGVAKRGQRSWNGRIWKILGEVDWSRYPERSDIVCSRGISQNVVSNSASLSVSGGRKNSLRSARWIPSMTRRQGCVS